MVSILQGVSQMLPNLAQQAEIDVAREAVANGEDPQDAVRNKGEEKKAVVLLFIGLLIGERRMKLFGGLIGLLVDVMVARLKKNNEIRKPTAEELAEAGPI